MIKDQLRQVQANKASSPVNQIMAATNTKGINNL
jgi:hypothetical protein